MPYSILSVINRSLLATPFEVFLNRQFIQFIRSNNIQRIKDMLQKGFNPDGYWDREADIAHSRSAYERRKARNSRLKPPQEPTEPSTYEIPFHEAVYNDSFEIIQILLEAGADPQIKDYRQRTGLFRAKNLEMIKFLMEIGLCLEHKSDGGYSYLHSVSSSSPSQQMQMLIEAGANVNSCNDKGYTVLMSTVMYPESRLEKIEILRRAGVDVTAVSNYGWNAFHAMIDDYREKHYENMYLTVRLLKRMGVNINQRTNRGYTALAKAAFEGSYFEMKAFLENGADPNIGFARNGKSETTMLDELPNYWCADKYKKIEMLKKFGAK